jgi:hypothetical protein
LQWRRTNWTVSSHGSIEIWNGRELENTTFGAHCHTNDVSGFNNARQFIDREGLDFKCYVLFYRVFIRAGNQAFEGGDFIPTRLTGSGYSIHQGRSLWLKDKDYRPIPGLPPEVQVITLNNNMQGIYREGSRWYRVDVQTGGVELVPGITGSAELNERGWVAGFNDKGELALWDGTSTRILGAPPSTGTPLIAAFNDRVRSRIRLGPPSRI